MYLLSSALMQKVPLGDEDEAKLQVVSALDDFVVADGALRRDGDGDAGLVRKLNGIREGEEAVGYEHGA